MAIEARPGWWTQFGRSLLTGIAQAGIGAGESALQQLIADYFRKGAENRAREFAREMTEKEFSQRRQLQEHSLGVQKELAKSAQRTAEQRQIASMLGDVQGAYYLALPEEERVKRFKAVETPMESMLGIFGRAAQPDVLPPDVSKTILDTAMQKVGIKPSPTTPIVQQRQPQQPIGYVGIFGGMQPQPQPHKPTTTEEDPYERLRTEFGKAREEQFKTLPFRSPSVQSGYLNLLRDMVKDETDKYIEAMRQHRKFTEEKADIIKQKFNQTAEMLKRRFEGQFLSEEDAIRQIAEEFERAKKELPKELKIGPEATPPAATGAIRAKLREKILSENPELRGQIDRYLDEILKDPQKRDALLNRYGIK